jgi:hypothetical protein
MKCRSITKKKEAHKIIKNKKLYIKNIIESIEDQKHNNARKMYQTINEFKWGSQHKVNAFLIFVYFNFLFLIFNIMLNKINMSRYNKKWELAMNAKEGAEIWKE